MNQIQSFLIVAVALAELVLTADVEDGKYRPQSTTQSPIPSTLAPLLTTKYPFYPTKYPDIKYPYGR